MNYEGVYQTLKTKLEALVPLAAVRLPNDTPADPTAFDIDITVTETGSTPYTEESTKHDVSIDMLTSVSAGTGTERLHHTVSRLVTAFDPLQQGDFWTDDQKHFVRIDSVSQKQANMTDGRYQINVRILAVIHT